MVRSTGFAPPRNIVILGAGYAGVMAANRLLATLTDAEHAGTRVTVVNPRDRFIERIRLHEVAAGSAAEASLPLTEILHPDAHVLIGEARLISPERDIVQINTATGPVELAYQELIYAVGSAAAPRVPGAREHTYFVGDASRAARAAAKLAELPAGGRVIVVGGGLTGIETASEIAEHRPDLRVVVLVGSGLLPGFGAGARRSARRALGRLGVQIIPGERVREARPGLLLADSDRQFPYDVCIWAAGFEVPDLASRSGLAVDDAGRLRVGEDLTALGAANIFGAGDCVVLPAARGAHLRMGCAAALPLGGHAARTVLDHARGTATAPASVGFLVQNLSLGRRNGVTQPVHADDRPRRLFLAGRAAAWFKEYICRLTVSGPRRERTHPGSYRAPAGPRHTRNAGAA